MNDTTRSYSKLVVSIIVSGFILAINILGLYMSLQLNAYITFVFLSLCMIFITWILSKVVQGSFRGWKVDRE